MVTRVPDELPEQDGTTTPTEDHLSLTLAPWRVSGREKIFARSGHVSQYLYGTCAERQGEDEQLGIVLSPESGVLVVDVDDDSFDDTPLGEYLSDHQPISTRGALGGLPNRHYLIDMRAFYRAGRFVKQGPITGGDVKSNGFVPAPGSTHPSGDVYQPVLDMANGLHVVECDEQLYGLLATARASAPRAAGGERDGSVGEGQEPALFSLTGRLVGRAMAKEDAWREWLAAALAFTPKDPAWPWSEKDRPVFDGHWARCTAMEQENYPGVGSEPGLVWREPVPAADEPVRALDPDEPDAVITGFAMPAVIPGPTDPLPVARILSGKWETREGKGGLKHWRGDWWGWRGAHWAEVSVDSLKAELYPLLENAVYLGGKEGLTPVAWKPTKPKVANVLEALAAVVHVLPEVDQPSWLENGEGLDRVVSLENGLLDLARREVYPHSAMFFNSHSLPFEYESSAVCLRWEGFLESIWPRDQESKDLLQEWFGYVLSGKTSLQKFMFIKGASRGGKGVIARTLTKLVGAGNVAGPTFESFASSFGLDSFIGKPLAVVGDARSSAKVDMQAVIGRILSLTGEDRLDVDRKYKTRWSGQLPSRLLILSNELPWFRDVSGALANRMLMLVLTVSFAGREDHRLEADLALELPGIFNWALGGLDRLAVNQGRFTTPESSRETAQEFMDAMSPVQAFVRQTCEVGEGLKVPKEVLWIAWQMWCGENEHQPGGKTRFMAVLRDAVPSVTGDQKVRFPEDSGDWVKCYTGLRYLGAGA